MADSANNGNGNGHGKAIENLERQVERLTDWQAKLPPAEMIAASLERLDRWRERSERFQDESGRRWLVVSLFAAGLVALGGYAASALVKGTIERALATHGAIPSVGMPIQLPADARIRQIRLAIRRLPKGDPQHWTATGAPRIDALELELPLLSTIATAERDYAWFKETAGAP